MTRDTMTREADGEKGMILINVLVIVMLATAILAVMIAGDDNDIALSIQMREVAQAQAVARGGEASAVTALRRDLAGGAVSDSKYDEWGTIAETGRAIDGGTFDFAVIDGQDRFNLNNLVRNDLNSASTFQAILAQLALPAEFGPRIVELVRQEQVLASLADVRRAGMDEDQVARLASLATVLPEPTSVNLNSAPRDLIAILLNNPGRADAIVALRDRSRGLSTDDLVGEGIFIPPGTSLTSDYFWSRSAVTMGRSRQRLTTLLHRRAREGVPEVLALRRWRGAAPAEAPLLP